MCSRTIGRDGSLGSNAAVRRGGGSSVGSMTGTMRRRQGRRTAWRRHEWGGACPHLRGRICVGVRANSGLACRDLGIIELRAERNKGVTIGVSLYGNGRQVGSVAFEAADGVVGY